MPEAVLEKRVDKLEQAMMELVYQARRTEMSIEKLSEEMQAFKEEMSEFKRQQQEENKRKNKEWSNLAKKMGSLYEDLIAPALRPALSKYFNCDVSMEGQRMFRKLNGECYEVDAIAACKDKVFMIEVRSTPRQSDIKEIKEKAERFFEFFPEFKNKKRECS